jgi:hypothetical protein
MAIPPFRTKQTTNTTGTGTLTLNAASAEFRSFNAGFGGSSQPVRYALSRAGVYEIGYGTFNGGSPGTLTRSTVLASSNGGSLVNLAAGTTDVFFDFLPGDRQIRTVSTTATLDLTDLGNLVRCTPSADMTLNLPANATVPAGMGYLIRNDGTSNAIVFIDPSGSETLDGQSAPFPLFVGEAIEIFSIGASWRSAVRPSGWRLVARSSALTSASVDFVLPLYPSAARSLFRVEIRALRLATDGAFLQMRVDDAGGASFDAGATDYAYGAGYVSGAAAWAAAASTGDTAMRLSTDFDQTAAGNTIFGTVDFFPGAGAGRFPSARYFTYTEGNGGIYAGPQPWVGAGRRTTAMDVNALRFLASSGNIAVGDFALYFSND